MTTGCTSFSLIFKHHIRTRFDLILVQDEVDKRLDKQIKNIRVKERKDLR